MAARADWEMLQNSLNTVGSDALKRKALAQQQQQEMARIALQNQLAQTAQSRNEALGQHYNAMEDVGLDKNDVGRENADTNAQKVQSQSDLNTAKANALKKPVFIYDQNDKSGNAVGVDTTVQDAYDKMSQLQQQKPDGNFIISTTPPTDKVERTMDDGTTLYLDANHAAQYDEKIAETNKQSPAAPPKQEVRQVLNPAHVVGGEVDTNTPPYLSLTNTTSAYPQPPSTPALTQADLTPVTRPDPNAAPQQPLVTHAVDPRDIEAVAKAGTPQAISAFEQVYGQGSWAKASAQTGAPNSVAPPAQDAGY